MFGFKKRDTQKENPDQPDLTGLNLENLIIETMEDDLKKSKHRANKELDANFQKKEETKKTIPAKKKEAQIIPPELNEHPKKEELFVAKEPAHIPKDIPISDLEEKKYTEDTSKKQKTSPFFNYSQKEITRNQNENTPEKQSFDFQGLSPKKEAAPPQKNAETTAPVLDRLIEKRLGENRDSLVIKEDQRPQTAWKKLLLWSFFLFLILFILGSIYYLWTTGQINRLSLANLNLKEISLDNLKNISLSEKEAPKTEVPIFSENNPNYLNLNFNSLLKKEVRQEIENMAQKIISSGTSSPIEFIISDPNNNPIPLSVFIQKMEVSFSPELLSRLSEEFSIFIYSDEGKPRLGLTIDIAKNDLLKETLLKEEPNLPKELESLLLATNYKIENKPFQAGRYNELSTRYLNISSPEVISVDYALSEDQLIIGTSQATFRAIIDYLKIQNRLSPPLPPEGTTSTSPPLNPEN